MGVELPRDADMQERACSLLPLAGLSAAERYALLADVPPGALLFRPGHVMLYLGRDAGGRPLVTHDISSYYEDGEKKYIIAPHGLTVGTVVVSGPESDIKIGNALPLGRIPLGTVVHNVELKIGKGAQLVRSAGSSAQLIAKEGNYALLRLPSGELRQVHVNCRATIGVVSNPDHENITIGKAGRSRWLGVRPGNRGVVMNPCDHPHGGGEGKSPVGRKRPVTPWGKPAYGVKTRDKKKASNKFIVKRRK